MENMESFTAVYAIAYTILNSTENLRFGKEGYFHGLFSTGYFIKEKIIHFFGVPIRYRNTPESLRELEIACKYSLCGLVFPLQFLVLPNLSITVWKHGKY